MRWQEYQQAVALLYEQSKGIGQVYPNVYIPDKVTCQRRQIDLMIEVIAKTHTIKIVVDAKYRKSKLDIKDVEEVLALSSAVKGDKTVIVTNKGWTDSAFAKADFLGIDLRILTVEEALKLIRKDKWILCPECEDDCIVLDQDGWIISESEKWRPFRSGQCRNCKAAYLHCTICNDVTFIKCNNSYYCDCNFKWNNTEYGMDAELPNNLRLLSVNKLLRYQIENKLYLG